jgi:hypothetical protein
MSNGLDDSNPPLRLAPDLDSNEGPPRSRRDFAALLGALGALAMTGCTDDGVEPQATDELEINELQRALTGVGVLKVADTAVELRTISGGTTLWIALLQGIAAAGDGGGGMFYWSSTAKADDGWSVLNQSAANSAGWRRLDLGTSLQAAWFGAVAGNTGNQAPAIQAAISAASVRGVDVVLPGGTLRTTEPIVIPSSITVRGAGYQTVIHCTSGPAFRLTDAKDASIRDLSIHCDTGVTGIQLHSTNYSVNSGFTKNILIERVLVLMSGSGYAVEFKNDDYRAIHFNTTFNDVVLQGNSLATGIYHTAPVAPVGQANISSTGARFVNGAVEFFGIGAHLQYLDTFEFIGTRFAVNENAGSGRAIRLLNTNVCAVRACRFEHNDIDIELGSYAVGTQIDSSYFEPGKILYNGGANTRLNTARGTIISRQAADQLFEGRLIAGRQLELLCAENTNLISGANQSIADNSGYSMSFIRIVGPTSAFSIGSIKVPSAGDSSVRKGGMLVVLLNTTGQQMTLLHEDASATATERIHSDNGGANRVITKRCTILLYDQTYNNSGSSRWQWLA